LILNTGKKAKSPPLAPIEVKILVSRSSARKIEADSGTYACFKYQIFLLQKFIIEIGTKKYPSSLKGIFI
jgi:hypothetical protein